MAAVFCRCAWGSNAASDYITDKRKNIYGGLLPGLVTDTQDITGECAAKAGMQCDFGAAAGRAEGFRGELMQVPPMYSALT